MMEDGSHLHELLEALESSVLTLDRDRGADPATSIHRLFQSAHNLKSGLAMAGLERASKLFHGLEDGLDDIRRGRLTWTSAWADAVLEAVDSVRSCLDAGEDQDLDPVFQAPMTSAGAEPPRTLAADEAAAVKAGQDSGQGVYRIEKMFLPGLTRDDFDGHLILDDIRSVGTLVSVKPDWEAYSKATDAVIVRYLFQSPQSSDQLAELFFDPIIEVSPPPVRFRLLVVDDDRLTAKLIQKALSPFGEVVVAYDGAQGLQAFQSAFDAGHRFDVVVLDLEMPEVDGHGALDGIREYEEAAGVLGLDRCLVFMNTSNSDLKKIKASFRLQADRYFMKPLSTDQIKKTLEETIPWLENRRRGTK